MKTIDNEGPERWDLIIRPKTSLLNWQLKELWAYRDLILLFVRRDFVSIYKQTILGPLWFILQPLLTTILFTVVFGNIAQISTDDLPPVLYYMSGIVLWNYFQECVTKTSNTFINNAQIFGKVYFPRLSVPVSVVISNLILFAIQFLFFMGFFVYFVWQGVDIRPNMTIIYFPVLLIIIGGLGLGFGIIISALTTKYRDLKFLVDFGVKLLMYATPVVFPLSSVSGKYKLLLLANPMSSVIEAFRFSFLGKGAFDWTYLGYSASFMIIVLVTGILIFNKVEKNFMDTV